MNPLGIGSLLMQLMGGGARAPQAPSVPPPAPKPIPDGSAAMNAMAPAAPGMNMQDPNVMASLMGTLQQPTSPELPSQPGVVAPEGGKGMNPQFSQMLMQSLMGMNQAPQQMSLGQILSGRA